MGNASRRRQPGRGRSRRPALNIVARTGGRLPQPGVLQAFRTRSIASAATTSVPAAKAMVQIG